MKENIIVVGCGIFGLSTAFKFLQEKKDVTLIDPLPILDNLKSSSGESRNIRFSHANDQFYSRLSWEAAKEWKKIEKITNKKLFYDSGIVWFAAEDNGWEHHSEKTIKMLNIPYQHLNPEDAMELYPSLHIDDLRFVLHEPHGGILAAKKCLLALFNLCLDLGCDYINDQAKFIKDDIYVNNKKIEFDTAVWAIGPWIKHVFPFIDMIKVTMQDVVFFESPDGWEAEKIPAFNDIKNGFYGCGSLDGMGVKLGYDVKGQEFDITQNERIHSESSVNHCRKYMGHRFPVFKKAKINLIKTCQYTMTPDANWIIAPHPEYPRHWIIGAGSAHGFKHGPALGQYVKDIILNNEEPDPKFAITERQERPGGWRDLYQYE